MGVWKLIDWTNYDERLIVHGTTKKERTSFREKRRLSQKAPASLSYKTVKIGAIDGLTDGRDEELLITSTNQRYAKTINAMPGHNFNVGEIVYWENSNEEGSYWLITQEDVEDEINKKGGMELCNLKLRWQNTETLEIIERWITVAKPYFSNLEDIRQAEISTREFKIQIAYDSETSLLDLNKRFLMEKVGNKPKSYRITSVDSHTRRYAMEGGINGFLILNVEQDQFNGNTDRVDLMIANYISPTPPPPVPTEVHIEFSYTGNPEIKQGNSRYKEFVAVVMDSTGAPILGAIADITYELALPDLAQYISVEVEPGRIRLKAASKTPIGTIVNLIASYEGNEIGTLTVKVVGLF